MSRQPDCERHGCVLGLDVGSVSVDAAVLDTEGHVLFTRYARHHGRPEKKLFALLEELEGRMGVEQVAITGTGADRLGPMLRACAVNEVTAQVIAAGALYSDARSIIDIGGQDSKYILLEQSGKLGAKQDAPGSGVSGMSRTGAQRSVEKQKPLPEMLPVCATRASALSRSSRLKDFSMSSLCASGTGSFLDQQASRLGLNIEHEFAQTALRSSAPARIAGRCSVFAKSDMIHLQQKGTPVEDIVAGLCYALARSFKANIIGNRPLALPVAFVGGVAANAGVVRALREVLGIPDPENSGASRLFVPSCHAFSGALGAALFLLQGQGRAGRYPGLVSVRLSSALAGDAEKRLAPLNPDRAEKDPDPDPPGETEQCAKNSSARPCCRMPASGLCPPVDKHRKREALEDRNGDSISSRLCLPLDRESSLYLGIDIGSISTNIVLMDKEHTVVAKYYLMTASRPIEAVREGFRHIREFYGSRAKVQALAVTGSGRHLIGDLTGADVTVNEITAHARASVFACPQVDTIFEIGGQDSKYIRLEKGLVRDFTMNKACAAGTGSFLEEQAERLNISIKRDFAGLALHSRGPVDCGEQCTVFIDSEVTRCQQQGVTLEDIAGGLAYSIAANYLHKVVEKRPVGEHILFQGGVAHNRAVLAALESITGKSILVPEHNEVMGAIGCCLLAMEREAQSPDFSSSFKGFSVLERGWKQQSFQCGHCANRCDISTVLVEGHKPLFYGGRCERFEVGQNKERPELRDLFAERERLLMEAYQPRENTTFRGVIGYPRILTFYEYAPFFRAFFSELGFTVLLSPPTTPEIIHQGLGVAPGQMCFPTKVAYGHAAWMKETIRRGEADCLLVPSVRETLSTDKAHEYANHCSYIQFIPDLVSEALLPRSEGIRLVSPVLHFRLGKEHVLRELGKSARILGVTNRKDIQKACEEAYAAQARFRRSRTDLGREVLAQLGAGDRAVLLVGKAHNIHDPGTNMQLGRIFRRMGVQVIPGDLLDVFNSPEVGAAWRNMTLAMGQRSLAAADIVRREPRLSAVYLANFGCVNDSVYPKFFEREMGDKPYLLLEIDEHSAEAGVVTRCEAFMDAVRNYDASRSVLPRRPDRKTYSPDDDRVLYLPHAANGMVLWAAALRAHGIRAALLPPPGDESLAWGRKCLDGKECLPCTLMTGDMIRLLKEDGADPAKTAFFMPGSCGSCRYDLFNTLQQIVFEDNGLREVALVDEYRGANKELHAIMSGMSCGMLSWRGFTAADILEKLRLRIRPYEIESGATDTLYFQCLERLTKVVENKGNVEKAVEEVVRDMSRIPVDRSEPRPVIGLVGEAYLRNVDYASRNIIRIVEDMGGEVRMPAIMEVLWYTLYKQWYFQKLNHQWIGAMLRSLQHRLLFRMEKSMRRHSEGVLDHPYEKPIGDVIGQSGLGLDAGLGFGAAVEMARNGVSGIIHAIPFNCVPGTVIHGLEGRFRSLYPGIPFMTVICSGSDDAGMRIRLEALVRQCISVNTKEKMGESLSIK